jgi:hypothetical protein
MFSHTEIGGSMPEQLKPELGKADRRKEDELLRQFNEFLKGAGIDPKNTDEMREAQKLFGLMLRRYKMGQQIGRTVRNGFFTAGGMAMCYGLIRMLGVDIAP